MGTGIDITGQITERINSARADGRPLSVTYVDAEARPHISLRGSTHVHSEDQLAIWVRRHDGGLATAIKAKPHVGLLYRNSDTLTTIILYGRARVDETPAVRDRVFDESPQPERDHDPERNGVAVVIDLDEVSAITVGQPPVRMVRS